MHEDLELAMVLADEADRLTMAAAISTNGAFHDEVLRALGRTPLGVGFEA